MNKDTMQRVIDAIESVPKNKWCDKEYGFPIRAFSTSKTIMELAQRMREAFYDASEDGDHELMQDILTAYDAIEAEFGSELSNEFNKDDDGED